MTWFPNVPLTVKVHLFLAFNLDKGTPKEQGKRVLLANLDEAVGRVPACIKQ